LWWGGLNWHWVWLENGGVVIVITTPTKTVSNAADNVGSGISKAANNSANSVRSTAD